MQHPRPARGGAAGGARAGRRAAPPDGSRSGERNCGPRGSPSPVGVVMDVLIRRRDHGILANQNIDAGRGGQRQHQPDADEPRRDVLPFGGVPDRAADVRVHRPQLVARCRPRGSRRRSPRPPLAGSRRRPAPASVAAPAVDRARRPCRTRSCRPVCPRSRPPRAAASSGSRPDVLAPSESSTTRAGGGSSAACASTVRIDSSAVSIASPIAVPPMPGAALGEPVDAVREGDPVGDRRDHDRRRCRRTRPARR